jgi:hypothetical protein
MKLSDLVKVDREKTLAEKVASATPKKETRTPEPTLKVIPPTPTKRADVSTVVPDSNIRNFPLIDTQRKRVEEARTTGIMLPSGRITTPDFKMSVSKNIKEKFGIDVEDDSLQGRFKKLSAEAKLTADQRKEYGQLLQDYLQAGALDAPVRAGIVEGATIGDYMGNLREKAPQQTKEVEESFGFKAGRIGGEFAKYVAAYNAFGGLIGGAPASTAGGIGGMTGTLAPTLAQKVAATASTGALGTFTTELAKDLVIGSGIGTAEAMSTGGDVKERVAENFAYSVAFNALLGAGGKLIRTVKDLKNAKNANVVGEVARTLNITDVEAEKVIDDAVDFYVNKSGVASNQPFEQLQLPAPSQIDLTPKAEPITVYRGYAGTTDPKTRNLSKQQSIYDVIGLEQKQPELLPIEYYTLDPNVAKRYADRDSYLIKSRMKTMDIKIDTKEIKKLIKESTEI